MFDKEYTVVCRQEFSLLHLLDAYFLEIVVVEGEEHL